MAGLISPKPVPYMQHSLQYNPYQRGVQPYPDTPANSIPPLSHPTPHQPIFLPGVNPSNPPLTVNEESKIYALVIDLLDSQTRESALLELSKKREQYDDLALVLWHSFGTSRIPTPSQIPTLTMTLRYHACPPSGNRLCLPVIIPA